MSVFKKITAGLCAAALSFSLCSCSTNIWGSDITYGAVIDGVTIPAGVFILYQSQAYSDAQTYVEPESANPSASVETEATTTTAATTAASETTAATAFTDKVIEGKDVTTWINDKATEYMQEYVAVEEKFNELGLKLDDNEDKKADVNTESFWSYGGEYYESLGVSKDSFKQMMINTYKKNKIFDYYYGDGGEKAISKDDITAYIYANNAKINFIKMDLKDGSGNLLKSDGKAEIKKMAEDYITRAKGGEDFNTILKEYNDYYSKLQSDAAATDTAATDTAAADTAAADTAAADTAAADTTAADTASTDNTTEITKDGATPDAAVNEKIFSGEVKIGDIFLVEEDEVYYIVKFEDILGTDGTYYDDNQDKVRHSLKDDEFDETVKTWITNQTVERNEAAYKTYKIDKYMEEQQ